MKITKPEKREYVFGRLNELLLPLGYKLFPTGGDPRYVLNQEDRVIHFFFNFLDLGDIAFSKINITIKIVEEIVFEIKKPNQNYDFVDKKRIFLTTVQDNVTPYPNGFWDSGDYPIKSWEDVEVFTNWVIHYLENEGKAFIEKYSYLPNILAEMDMLENQELTWNNRDFGLLSGSLDATFRGLIISKLCNDTLFNEKIIKTDMKFSQPDYSLWLPYYEKLKERLKTVEPIYNVS